MASPQTRNLKTANGGKVAPQHYNDAMGDFEYSKGSDGALHTKVINQPSVTLVDKNGNPIDSENKLPVDVAFPTEQAVKDADVLAKLADIETKIQATNDRLNQTLNTQLTGSNVALSITGDLVSFEKVGSGEKILSKGVATDFDENIREIGNILYQPWLNTEKYKMPYSGHQGTYAGNNVYVGIATSEDGKTWTKKGKVINRSLEDPYLVYYNGTYYLYAEDKEDVPFRNIRLFTSSDLITWTDRGDVLDIGAAGSWDATDVSSPTVWVENGTWYMLYEGRGPNQFGAIGLATSSDGIVWTKSPSNPVAIGNNPDAFPYRTPDVKWVRNLVPDDVIKVNGVYYLIVHGFPYETYWVPIVLTSTDLIKWNDYSGKPIDYLVRNTTDDGTAMILHDGGYYLTYASKGIWRVPIFGPIDKPVKTVRTGNRPRIRQIADGVTVGAGQSLIIDIVANNSDIDEVTYIVTSDDKVNHNFTARIVQRIDISDPEAWVDVVQTGAGLKNAIQRQKITAHYMIEYRITNNDTVPHTYNAWVEEWPRS